MKEKLIFETENGEQITFFVEEETRVGGVSYLLVTDSDKDEANAWILKDTSADGEEEANYVIVEDDVEFDAIADVFSKMMEGTVFTGG